MSETLDKIAELLKAEPDAKVWVEEALIRGGPGKDPGGWGFFSGAHATFGLERTDAVTGRRVRSTLGPFPLSDLPGGTSIEEVLGLVVTSQQATIDQHVADLAAAREAAEAAIAAAGVQRDEAVAKALAERDAALADATARVTAAESAKAVAEAERDALGTKPEAQKILAVKLREALVAEKAEAEAKQASIEAKIAKIDADAAVADAVVTP